MGIKLDNNLVKSIDYSNIQEYKVSDTDCENLALKAKEFGFNTVVVAASSLPIMKDYLGDTDVKIASAVSYPSGAYILESKLQEIKGLLELDYKIDELYVTMAVGRYLSGYSDEAVTEIKTIVDAAKGKKVKLIIEAGVMTIEQKQFICDTAAGAGIDSIVASAGFAPYDVPFPEPKDIKELTEASKGRLKIVACGGIDTKEKALAMLEAGADRICTTKGMEIAKES